MVPRFGYFSGLLTQEGNTLWPFSSFLSPMVRTVSVEAIFTEQYSNTIGPICLIIQSPMVTSLMMTSHIMEVVVSTGYDTQMGDDDWINTGINSDNRDFESNENETKEEWLNEDNNNNEDQDEDGDEDDQSDINIGESESRLHEPL